MELIHNGKSLGVREVVNGEAVFAVPFINGENLLDARSGGTFRQAEDTDEIVIFPSY